MKSINEISDGRYSSEKFGDGAAISESIKNEGGDEQVRFSDSGSKFQNASVKEEDFLRSKRDERSDDNAGKDSAKEGSNYDTMIGQALPHNLVEQSTPDPMAQTLKQAEPSNNGEYYAVNAEIDLK